MKFEEKLIKLRKEKALSQEELGNQLDVTRQTISKWELGQSKPDMEKLIAMSKLFNVDIETLTDDDADYKKDKTTSNEKNKNIALIAIIIIGIVIVIALVARGISNKALNTIIGNANNTDNNIIGRFFEYFDKILNQEIKSFEESEEESKEMQQEVQENMNQISEGMNEFYKSQENMNQINEGMNEFYKSQKISDYNGFIDSNLGVNNGIIVKNKINQVIETNNKHPEKIISVIFNGEEYNSIEAISGISSQMDDWSNYLVLVDYDAQGYITALKINEQ